MFNLLIFVFCCRKYLIRQFCVHYRKTQNITMCYGHVKGVIIFLFLHAMMSFGEQNPNSDADIINTCMCQYSVVQSQL